MKEIDFTGLVQLQPHIHRTLLMRTYFHENSPLCKMIIIICAVFSFLIVLRSLILLFILTQFPITLYSNACLFLSFP